MSADLGNATPDIEAHEYAQAMQEYVASGERRANALANRGPVCYDDNGNLHPDILRAYWQYGFYVFEQIVGADELADLRADLRHVLDGAPTGPDSTVDARGDTALGGDFARRSFRFARPLSDPLGGTARNQGRHPVKMTSPKPASGAPAWTIELILGNLQLMDANLRLYGHPDLLSIAEAITGPDFVPYTEVVFLKEPGLGVSVAWHQDGLTHWDASNWHQGSHGFNFMTQLYASTAANGVWVLPGSHKLGRVDIKALVQACGSERLPDAVPMIANAGDVMVMNRQLVHGSFANSSPDRRATLNAGFFPRDSVLNVSTKQLSGHADYYPASRIEERSRIIGVAIDARAQRYPSERRYDYAPHAGLQHLYRFDERARQEVIHDYNVNDIFI